MVKTSTRNRGVKPLVSPTRGKFKKLRYGLVIRGVEPLVSRWKSNRS